MLKMWIPKNRLSVFSWETISPSSLTGGIATMIGGTLEATLDLLKEAGCQKIKGIFLVAAPEGLSRIQQRFPEGDIYVAAIDDHLNDQGYILPGLGDAGDKIFGTL